MRGKNSHPGFRPRRSGGRVGGARPAARLGSWSRRKIASAVGLAGLLAGVTAVALIAAGAGAAHPNRAYADAALSNKDGLQAIYRLHPDLGKPVIDLITEQKLPEPAYVGDHSSIGVPKGVLNPVTTAGGAVTGYRPGPYAGDLTPLQLASLALRAGCSPSESVTAAAIAASESGGNPGAQGDISMMDSTWDWSEGLWQIRGLRAERGTGGLRDSLANANPLTNANAMYVISRGCTDWTSWTTYTSRAFLAYLPLMKSAVESAVGYKVKTGAYPPVAYAAGPVSVPSRYHASGPSNHSSRHRAHRHRTAHRPASTRRSHRAHQVAPGGRVPAPQPSSTRTAAPAPTRTPIRLPKPSLPTSKLPTSGLPSLPTSKLPTSGLPSLPTSKLPTSGLPSLP